MRILSVLAGVALVLAAALLVGVLAMCDVVDDALAAPEEWWL